MRTDEGRASLLSLCGGDWPMDPPAARSRRKPGDEGWPKVIGRSNGWPLEVRVWHQRPRGVADAVYHPSGCWLTVRILGMPAIPS